MASRHVVLGLAWLAMAAGCGGAGPGPAASGTTELARAEGDLQAELEAAVDRLGLASEPGERVMPVRCNELGRKEVTGGYRIRLRLHGDEEELLRRAAAFWRDRGRNVRVVGRKGAFPAVFATADPGWTFALQIFPERGEALLSGGTPCLPDPDG